METQICSRPLRLSPLKNSFSELNTLWDRDDEITFEDVLGGDCCSPRITCRLDFESRLPLGLYYSLVLFVLSHTSVNSSRLCSSQNQYPASHAAIHSLQQEGHRQARNIRLFLQILVMGSRWRRSRETV